MLPRRLSRGSLITIPAGRRGPGGPPFLACILLIGAFPRGPPRMRNKARRATRGRVEWRLPGPSPRPVTNPGRHAAHRRRFARTTTRVRGGRGARGRSLRRRELSLPSEKVAGPYGSSASRGGGLDRTASLRPRLGAQRLHGCAWAPAAAAHTGRARGGRPPSAKAADLVVARVPDC